ncbi:MAG: HlyD family type I secretion periplasmic adaptor subunit [Rhodobacter sp.]|nr:HlyD family type I secretion periplasmic adaptor subunit [Paracoccaceae bacterium]MCC0075629.1 HlyD family type I secretion periplasmic adaptor subunit [Rhodobacter sp.]
MKRALDARGPLTLGLVAALLLLAGVGVWAAQVPLAGAVFAPGEVDTTALGRPVQPPETGIVAVVAVVEGQRLEAGDLVIRLDDSTLQHEWDLVTAQWVEALARQQRLRVERDGTGFPPPAPSAEPGMQAAVLAQRRLFEARALTLRRQQAQLAQRRLQIAAELAGLEAQTRAIEAESALIATDRARHEALRDQGLTTGARATELARETARMQGARAMLETRSAELRGQDADLALQAETLLATRREEAETQLAEIAALLPELAVRRALLADRRARLELRAPIAGRVLGLTVTGPGPMVAAGDTVATIIPRDTGPTVTLNLRADDVDRVYPGQPATLRIPAFAAAGVPDLAAEVTDIAAAALTDPHSGARQVRVRLALTPGGQAALRGRALLPGMSVQGFIATGPRTPLGYLLAPVTEAMQRALREP